MAKTRAQTWCIQHYSPTEGGHRRGFETKGRLEWGMDAEDWRL